MKKIIERSYLDKLKRVMGTPDIKVITGVRRSGKSVLLRSFEQHVVSEVDSSNVIHIDLNNLDFEELQEYHKLNEYIEERYVEGRHNFLLIDEVQMCSGFEKAINSLHNSMKYDIYITGSNAFLLSSDLATLFTGRTYTIELFPFSLKEYMKYHEVTDTNAAFDSYLVDGGFAGSYIYREREDKYKYVADVYNTLIIRDIQQKYGIQNVPMLNRVSEFLINNISNLTTGRTITNTLNSDGQKVNHVTVDSYLRYLCEAYAFYKVKRYDVKGKAYLYSQDKYYLCDHVVKYAKLGTNNMDYGQMYENIVAIELMRRGYEVYVGTNRGKEIDFVVKRPNEQMYIQVSYDVSSPATLRREVTPLLEVGDAYPKILIARTRQPEQNYEGVRVVDIAEWLVGE